MIMMEPRTIVLCFLMSRLSLGENQESLKNVYRAAVLEHVPVPTADNPLDTMLANVGIYAQKAALASQKGAQIIVFPEYGITGFDMPGPDRLRFYDFLQDIPDPKEVRWNPCTEPEKYGQNTRVIKELSCIANSSAIVVVANLLSRVPCRSSDNSSCPEDEQFIFNTNVIFGNDGMLLGRYHKRHLFNEKGIDAPERAEIVIVDVGYTRLATFICFDLMFADPAIQLIENYGIRNFAFSTAWVDELPFFTSIQSFSAFARSRGVNLIAANIHHPQNGNLGSGIYSSAKGALKQGYDLAADDRMFIADLPSDPSTEDDITFRSGNNCPSQLRPDWKPKSHFVSITVDVPSSAQVNESHFIWYQILVNSKYEFLKPNSQTKTVCHRQICCHLEYKMWKLAKETSYVLVAFSDYHGREVQHYYLEICAVLRCEKENIKKCGQIPNRPTTSGFWHLMLKGNFSINSLYPSVLSTKLSLIPSTLWTFTKRSSPDNCSVTGKISMTSSIRVKILSAQIVGRVFKWDPIKDE